MAGRNAESHQAKVQQAVSLLRQARSPAWNGLEPAKFMAKKSAAKSNPVGSRSTASQTSSAKKKVADAEADAIPRKAKERAKLWDEMDAPLSPLPDSALAAAYAQMTPAEHAEDRKLACASIERGAE
jgi:hypothetical protein